MKPFCGKEAEDTQVLMTSTSISIGVSRSEVIRTKLRHWQWGGKHECLRWTSQKPPAGLPPWRPETWSVAMTERKTTLMYSLDTHVALKVNDRVTLYWAHTPRQAVQYTRCLWHRDINKVIYITHMWSSYRDGNQGTEKRGDLPNVTESVSVRDQDC